MNNLTGGFMKSKETIKEEKKEDTLLTVKQISEKTKLSPSTIYTILHFSKLQHETIGNRIVVKESVFNDWQKENIKVKDKEE